MDDPAAAIEDGIPAALVGRLTAFARTCVIHGDMTPTAERVLLGILRGER